VLNVDPRPPPGPFPLQQSPLPPVKPLPFTLIVPPDSIVRFVAVSLRLFVWTVVWLGCVTMPPFCIVRFVRFRLLFCINSKPLLSTMILLLVVFRIPFWRIVRLFIVRFGMFSRPVFCIVDPGAIDCSLVSVRFPRFVIAELISSRFVAAKALWLCVVRLAVDMFMLVTVMFPPDLVNVSAPPLMLTLATMLVMFVLCVVARRLLLSIISMGSAESGLMYIVPAPPC